MFLPLFFICFCRKNRLNWILIVCLFLIVVCLLMLVLLQPPPPPPPPVPTPTQQPIMLENNFVFLFFLNFFSLCFWFAFFLFSSNLACRCGWLNHSTTHIHGGFLLFKIFCSSIASWLEVFVLLSCVHFFKSFYRFIVFVIGEKTDFSTKTSVTLFPSKNIKSGIWVIINALKCLVYLKELSQKLQIKLCVVKADYMIWWKEIRLALHGF